MSPCSELSGVIDRLSPDRPVPEDLLAHVSDCENCARASARQLLEQDAAQYSPDEDEAVLASVGLATADITMRLKSKRAADPDLAADWQAIEALHAPRAPHATSSGTRPTMVWLAAAGLLIAAVGAAGALALLQRTAPVPAGLLPRGDAPPPRFELAIGEPMRFCRPNDTCRWKASTEPLVVHYRGQAMPTRVTIQDAVGESSQLFPDLPEEFQKPAAHPCPPDQWCVVDGGLYDAPAGRARLCIETVEGAKPPLPCFNLEVID